MPKQTKNLDLFDYLRTAEQQLRTFEQGDAKDAFLRVIVEEIHNRELDCVTQQKCSKIIEYVLRQIRQEEPFLKLFKKLFADPTVFILLAQNQYAFFIAIQPYLSM